jgi:hypothetical protein
MLTAYSIPPQIIHLLHLQKALKRTIFCYSITNEGTTCSSFNEAITVSWKCKKSEPNDPITTGDGYLSNSFHRNCSIDSDGNFSAAGPSLGTQCLPIAPLLRSGISCTNSEPTFVVFTVHSVPPLKTCLMHHQKALRAYYLYCSITNKGITCSSSI